MDDQSFLDRKYFIDSSVYNCPFCNRRNVRYSLTSTNYFDWNNRRRCYVYLVQCTSCEKKSMHLSFSMLRPDAGGMWFDFEKYEVDNEIFYSVPTSFFIVDSRIPRTLRELITESEGCLKMNYLTGASACMRKAIYELLVNEKVEGPDYQTRIKTLKQKYESIDPGYFDVLAHIQDMTSDKIHEQSWDKWDSPTLVLINETLKSIFYEMYVLPIKKKERRLAIEKLRHAVKQEKPKEQEN